MPSADPARRAVVTGLGAVMPIGNDFETYWSNLRNAVTGTRRIQSFDPSGFEVQIAAEVLDFDPTTVMDAKMARRMSRFIHLAMGAGKEAVASSGIDFAAMSRGPARPRRRRREHGRRRDRGDHRRHPRPRHRRARGSCPRSRSRRCRARWPAACCRWSTGSPGPVMTQVAACATSVIAFHDALRLIATGECDVVLAGGSEAPVRADGRRGARQHGRAVEAQRLARDGVAPVRRDPRRVRARRGRGRGGRRVARARARARRDADRRDPRRGADRRRVPHLRAGPDGPRPGARDDQRPAQRGRRARRDRLDRRPRHLDVAQRRDRDAGDQGGLRLGRGDAGRSARPSR